MKKLERRLELPAVIAISISAMLGSGIFVLPGLASITTGSSVWLAFLIAALAVLPAALSKSELATAMPTSGGTYVYLERTFGPMTGTVAGLGLWMSLLFKSAFVLVGFSAYASVIYDVPIKPTALVLLSMITLLNLRGVGKVSKFQTIVVVICLISLAGLGVLGGIEFDWEKTSPFLARGTLGLMEAVALVFLSYAGIIKVAAIAEEVKNPARNLPLGILISLAVAALLYAGVSLLIAGNVGVPQALADGSSPQPDLRPVHSLSVTLENIAGGTWISIAIAVVGVLTMTSMANAGLLAASRFPFAMARDNLVPRRLATLHKRFLTPANSILLSSFVMAFSVMFLEVEKLAKLASAFMIMMFAAVNVTVIVLRESHVQWYKPAFRSPLYPWTQIFGVLSGAYLLFVLGIEALAAGVVIVLVGALLFMVYGRKRTQRKSIMGKRGRRQDLLTAVEAGEEETRDVSVVVPLFGRERSPEMLVELASSLADERKVEVVHLTDVPEQTSLDDAPEESNQILSLQRRIKTMAAREKLDVTFDAVVSHDLLKTINDLSGSLHCKWLVMEWRGRSRWSLTFHNPLGWLREHLDCNLATFYDAGVRYIEKILVYVVPGPHDALVARTADFLARLHGAELTFIRFASEGGSMTNVQAEADYLDQVRQLCSARTHTLLLRGSDEAQAIAGATGAYDLLILSPSTESGWSPRLSGTLTDRVMAKAACSVLRLQTPRKQTHESVSDRHEATSDDVFRLLDYIEPGCLKSKLELKRKDAWFNTFAEAFAAVMPDELSAEAVLTALQERERAQNTSIGMGMALPHATLPQLKRTYLGVFTAASPVDYQAPDGAGVDVFFVTLGGPGDRGRHLKILSRIATLVKETDLLERLRQADSDEGLRSAMQLCGDKLRQMLDAKSRAK